MKCQSCDDRGLFQVAYHDGSKPDIAICLCKAGDPFRVTTNNGKQHVPTYQVWALRHGLDPDHVKPMEEILTDEEMAARGFSELSTAAATDALTDAIAAAAKKRGKR